MWEERGRSYPVDDPAALDGFDQPFSKMTPEAVARITGDLMRTLALRPRDHVLEVGCGAGSLMSWMAHHTRITGTDLAFGMLQRGRTLWPALRGVQADALRLPFRSGGFAAAFSHSVFLYFPDYNYARVALSEMRRVVRRGGGLVIADVPDLEGRETYLQARADLATNASPVWRSSVAEDLEHLYYDRDFFRDWAAEQGCGVRFTDRDVPGYLNGRFRFDVVLQT